MEERVPLTSRSPGHRVQPTERRSGTIVDEGSLELLEHLIAIVLQGNTQYLETLLQNEEILEVVDMHDNKGFTALHIASERVDVECVRLLLEADANPNVMDRFSRTALHWVVSGGCHCDFCDTKRARCTELLVRAKGNLEMKDCKGETPLSYAAKNSFYKVATVMIEHGAEIHRTCNDVSTAHLILQKVPQVMTHLLDQSVANDHDDNSKLKVDFKVLLPPPAPPTKKDEQDPKNLDNESSTVRKRPRPQRELALIESFVSSSPPIRQTLLTHPVTSTFLYLKWNYIWKWFWFIRILYTALAISYTYFVFKLYLVQCPFGEKSESPGEGEGNAVSKKCDAGLELLIAGICILAWVGLMALSAFYSLIHSCSVACTSGLNIAWWLLIGCVTLTILPVFGILNEYWRWQYFAAAFSVLLVWIMNFRHLSQIPAFGNYVHMFTTVLRRTVFALLTFAAIFYGFVFGFCILFPKSLYFKNISTASLRLFLVMVGEYDYDGVFAGSSTESHPLNSLEFWTGTGSHIYYIAFIVVFGIALMNLFIALAVTSVQEMEKNAEIVKICKQIEAIAHLESMLDDNWILNCLQKCILGQISVYCRNGRYFRLSPMDPRDTSLPPEIKAAFIPLVHTRDCLNKREILSQQVRLPGHVGQGQTLNRNDPFRGSGHSQQNGGAKRYADIDDILIELKQTLEGLQRRRVAHPRANPVFC